MVAAKRLRIAISAIRTVAGERVITASCGVARRLPQESVPALIARADAALYRAKHGGRNAAVLA